MRIANCVCMKAVKKILENKRILILGFGKEGRSTYGFLRKYFPNSEVAVADRNPNLNLDSCPELEKSFLGEKYLDAINRYDVVIQSPGVCLKDILPLPESVFLTSQTDLFLRLFASRCIAVTGTKGKSTTSSLIYHILKNTAHDVLLGGNIGNPLFNLIPLINEKSVLVLELSCHQLEFVKESPHVALLLNLFEEHLDHYIDFAAYQKAKYNIGFYQKINDIFISPLKDEKINFLLKNYPLKSKILNYRENDIDFGKDFPLKGEHNRMNAIAAFLAVKTWDPSISEQGLKLALRTFKSLPHRLEYVGCVNGISFYNDSISTIPQASIAAVKALEVVDTLILGGMDRGIDYSPLRILFSGSSVKNFIFTGEAGKRMMRYSEGIKGKKFVFFDNYEDIVREAKLCTEIGKICLLSPAAPSYDAFKNFEERGEVFKKLVLS